MCHAFRGLTVNPSSFSLFDRMSPTEMKEVGTIYLKETGKLGESASHRLDLKEFTHVMKKVKDIDLPVCD